MSEDNPPKAAVKKARAKGPKIPKKISEKYLYNSALAYLQRFPSSTSHFKTVMGRKIERSCRHHTEQDRDACYALLDQITRQFCTLGYLNDALYLRGMINSLRRRGLSTAAITLKLTQKGLPGEEIRRELKAYDTENDVDDLSAARRLCQRKKIGPYATAPAPGPAQRQKWLAALARAGFSYETASRALDDDPDQPAINLL